MKRARPTGVRPILCWPFPALGGTATWQNEAKFLNDYMEGWLEFIDGNGGGPSGRLKKPTKGNGRK
jgi:hypothetical protein